MAIYATFLVLIGIVGLFWLDRRDGWTSPANYVPFFWLLIAMSRPVTSWTSSPSSVAERAASYLEGSPLDRSILIALIVLAGITLWRRKEATLAILRGNTPIILFLLYCLVSVSWSDYPMPAFKRWIRAVGDVMMILVILTDKQPETAIKSVLSRVGFILVPLSILFIRFFPELGRAYSIGGRPMWTGVCTDKNGLGAICMIVGAVVLWRWINTYAVKDLLHRTAQLTALTAMLAMIGYLLSIVDSKTALMCFVFASVVIVCRPLFRRPWMVFSFVVATVAACYVVLIEGVAGEALEAIGRNESLTGRTDVWARVLSFVQSPWLGYGYESFWMGPRLAALQSFGGNTAHNGYLEIYVNLGYLGLFFLAIVILGGYRHMIASVKANPDIGRLKVAFFLIALTYNFSEAAFKMMMPVWLMFIWATLAEPAARLVSVPKKSPSRKPIVTHTFVPRTSVKVG